MPSEPFGPSPLRLVLTGPPGSGKGTQAGLLADRFGFAAISTGELLRAMARSDGARGVVVRRFLAAGRLVPDRLVLEVVRERLGAVAGRHAVLDGYPRTLRQLGVLEAIVNPRAILAVELVAGPACVEARMAARGRFDDGDATVPRRLSSYARDTGPMLDHLARHCRLVRVEAEGSIDTVHEALVAALRESEPATGVGSEAVVR
jgi:adenylate kinase